MIRRLVIALLTALPLFAGDPSPIEDSNFMPESGWNRDDAVLQYNAFTLNRAVAHELTQEWATASPKHQLSFTVPIYDDGATGLGDVALNYRYQLFGNDRFATAPRVSLLLPTRSAHFGERSSGVQVNVPLSINLTDRLVSHTSAGATWYRERQEDEVQIAQSVAFALTPRIALSVDAAWTRCEEDHHLLVVRPGVQVAIDGPGGTTIAPGIALPFGTDQRGLLVFVAFERAFRRN